MNDTNNAPEVLITGGTGLLGKVVCAYFEKNQIPFKLGTRRRELKTEQMVFMDLADGAGLKEAVSGMKAILHLASDKKKPDHDVSGTKILLQQISKLQNQPHLIYISIVGVDQLPLPYFKQKFQVEQAIREANVPYSILRSTQFHDCVSHVLNQLLRWPVGLMPKKIPIQPIDIVTVAEKLFQMAQQVPSQQTQTIGGKQLLLLEDAAESWLEKNGKKRLILDLPIWGVAGKNLKEGALTCPYKGVESLTWNEWLSSQ